MEEHRRELTAHCYRMLGSATDAEDAAQVALTKAWRAADRFENRSSVRTWLYRIATNVCMDELRGRQRRVRPMDLSEPTRVVEAQLVTLPDGRWLEPVPDARVIADVEDPAEQVAQRESVRLAFVAALQHLPPKQRAVLLLRDVLAWQASEVAELLDTSVAAVNSALQRARATLAEREPVDTDVLDPLDAEQADLLSRYLEAFERYDMTALRALLLPGVPRRERSTAEVHPQRKFTHLGADGAGGHPRRGRWRTAIRWARPTAGLRIVRSVSQPRTSTSPASKRRHPPAAQSTSSCPRVMSTSAPAHSAALVGRSVPGARVILPALKRGRQSGALDQLTQHVVSWWPGHGGLLEVRPRGAAVGGGDVP